MFCSNLIPVTLGISILLVTKPDFQTGLWNGFGSTDYPLKFSQILYQIYLEYKTLTPKVPIFAKLLHFCAQFGIAWLLKFNYEYHIHLPEPFPKFICSVNTVSWWRKFNEKIVEDKFETWKKFGLQKRRLPSSTNSPKSPSPHIKGKEAVGSSQSLSPYSINVNASSPAELKKLLLEALSSVGSDEEVEEPIIEEFEYNPYLENNDPDIGFFDQ